jgi:transcription termination/antitermination protein NusG
MISIIKVTTNKEESAMELIRDRTVKKELNVYSLIHPLGLKGYIILESEDRESVEEAVFNTPYTKEILKKSVSYEDIQNLVEPKIEEMKIEKNDIVEIISEPFKKEKAKVLRIDRQKGEVVVILLQAAIPIPVTIKMDNVKVIRREEAEEAEK